MNATANFSNEVATKIISSLMQQHGITREELLAVFPNRPTTPEQFQEVSFWIGKVGRDRQYSVETRKVSVNPARPSSPQNWDDIPDGNYAFEYKGKTHFYRVSRKQGKGKWSGRTFVNVQERASSVLYPMDWKPGLAVLHRLRELGTEACGLLFSERLGKCRACFEDLTDEENPYKPYGFGPVCGPKRMG